MKKFTLLFILILATFLRFWQLGKIPEGLHADEAAFGYNAYSLELTARDEYGQFLPLVLRSFDDYKGAVYAYLTIPFLKFFDLSELAVRLPSAIFGVLLIVLTYLLVIKLTGRKDLALLTAFLVSISPLSVLLSRVQSDPLVAVFFVLLGFYFFLLWQEKPRFWYLFLNCFFWVISFFAYAAPRIFLPVFALLLFVFYFRQLTFRQKRLLIVAYILVLMLAVFLIFGAPGARFGQINVFQTPRVTLLLEESIREDSQMPIPVVRFFHNKLVGYGRYFLESYFQYLSFDFLFLKGGLPPREVVPNMGIMYLIELPFLILGLYFVFRRRVNWGYLMVSWLLLTPAILSFSSGETPNVHRFFLAILPIELMVAFGAIEFFKIIRQKKILFWLAFVLTIMMLIQNFTFFLHQLFVHQPVHQPWYRGYAYKELNTLINKYSPDFRQIKITKGNSSPYIYLLFYQKYDPRRYQALGSPRDFENTGFDKYYFVSDDCPLRAGKTGLDEVNGEEGVLYINRGDCLTPKHSVKVLDTVKWGDNSAAFILLEYVANEKISE